MAPLSSRCRRIIYNLKKPRILRTAHFLQTLLDMRSLVRTALGTPCPSFDGPLVRLLLMQFIVAHTASLTQLGFGKAQVLGKVNVHTSSA